MRILPALVILMLVFLFYKESFAQSSAVNAAKDEKRNQMVAGALGVATGAAMAYNFCGNPNPSDKLMCVIAIGGAAESLLTRKNAGSNTNPSIDPLDYKTVCETDPQLCETTTFDYPPYPDYPNDVNTLREYGKNLGLNIDDPKSISKFLSDHAGDLGGADQTMANLSPEQLERIDKIKKDAASKFHISSVPLEGGGGSFARRGGRDSSGLDLSKFMTGLNGDKKDESGGLQRKLASGEPVGVASDDIFKIVSRRYQTKIQSKAFLFKK